MAGIVCISQAARAGVSPISQAVSLSRHRFKWVRPVNAINLTVIYVRLFYVWINYNLPHYTGLSGVVKCASKSGHLKFSLFVELLFCFNSTCVPDRGHLIVLQCVQRLRSVTTCVFKTSAHVKHTENAICTYLLYCQLSCGLVTLQWVLWGKHYTHSHILGPSSVIDCDTVTLP